MPKYFYNATSLEGEPRTGVKEAESEQQLAKILRQEGYILVSAHLEERKKRLEIFGSLSKISLKEKLFFTRNLRLMIKSGISLPKALNILSAQSRNQRFQGI